MRKESSFTYDVNTKCHTITFNFTLKALFVMKIIDVTNWLISQEAKFGRLTEYNKRKIFLEKLYTKCGG